MSIRNLVETIIASGKIPNEDSMMHAHAILDGQYTLIQLLADADAFYSFNGYAHDAELHNQL